jgi:hypothetical protein
MAQSITITIQDDAKAILLLNYFSKRYGYKDDIPNPDFDDIAEVPNPAYNDQIPIDPITNPFVIPNPDFDDNVTIPNPETKKMFLKRFTIRWWREAAVAGWQKEQQAIADAEFNDTNITID